MTNNRLSATTNKKSSFKIADKRLLAIAANKVPILADIILARVDKKLLLEIENK